MNKTQFETTIAEIIDVPTDDFEHPFLTKVKFTFADDKGNANKQGIEAEDFDTIAKSSVHMPLKIRYTHAGAGGHEFSVPFGHITRMYQEASQDGSPQLIGEGVLYKEEYPDEVEYLKSAFENNKAPGISWELSYQDSISKAGIEWLKGVVTRAATFVKFPAYGNRTGLLAIAQNNILAITESQMMDTEFMDELKEIVDELNSLVKGTTVTEEEDDDEDDMKEMMGDASQNTGGNEVDELQKAQAELEAALAKVTELTAQLETAQTTITDLTTENEGFKRQALVAERTAKIVEAGIKIESDQEKLAQKQELWLAMSPEIFEAYVTDLAEASKTTPAPKDAAASRKEGLPKFTAVAGQEQTLDDLKAVARRASRGIAADI